ncbi:MAG: histone deacetylase [Pseudomonadota bacterium]
MQKFILLHEYLVEQGIAGRSNVFRPGSARRDALETAHCPHYLDKFEQGTMSAKEIRRLGLPWSEGLVKRSLISPNGTFLTASMALTHGLACHLAGGTHHAHYDFGSGYCILNDLAITALCLLAQEKVNKVVIFDCDVHQGDGTAAILAQEPRVFTCSLHCEQNFPQRKAQSDLDVSLPKGMGDDAYLDVVSQTLEKVLAKVAPDLVLYDAGVDVYRDDPLGLLNISMDGIRLRDRLVLETVIKSNTPIATVIGGGYDTDQQALAIRHAIVVEEAHRVYEELG